MNKKLEIILFIDDEPWFNRGMVDELKDAGYDVIPITGGGSEALEVLQLRRDIDLIVLDIMMPPGNSIADPAGGRRTGVKVCEHIRQKMKLRMPIIFLTVIEDQAVHDCLEEIERGAGLEPTILVKPVAPLELLDEVNALLGNPSSEEEGDEGR